MCDFPNAGYLLREGADTAIPDVAAANRDLRQLHAGEEALRKRESTESALRVELTTLIETIPAAVCIAADPGCRSMIANRALHEMLRVPNGRNVSKSAPAGEAPVNFEVYKSGIRLAPEQLPVQTAAATGQSVTDSEIELHFSDGEARTLMASAFPLFDDEGATRGAIGSFVDVTAYKIALQRLQEVNRRKDDFMAVLGHELRSPLAAMRNALHLLAYASGEEVQARAREILHNQVEQLIGLSNDLTDQSRVTRGKLEIRSGYVDLSVAVHAALETCQPLLDRHGHTFELSLPGTALGVNGDALRLQQIFINLLNNAAKFTPSPGRIWLTVERAASHAVVRVRDNGIGISPSMLPRIFELYAQAREARDTSPEGLGIGLSLVKHLVELHGGTVRANSGGLASGTEIVVTLPLVDAERHG